MQKLLKKYFGYDSFRLMQEEIVNNILLGNDTLVLMPTGGGKSICYQLPALKLDGITLVISPLISLMKDQVDSLKSKGIPAEFINSTLGIDELADIKFRILTGKIKLLYIAPERLKLKSFEDFLKMINVSLIAIDEAHCISEWGHDFRPDYGNLSNLREILPGVPIIALTATATKKVQKDICSQLSFSDSKIFFSSFDRSNLYLRVMKKQKTFEKLLILLKKHKDESSIIYCFSRKEAERISEKLKEKGFNALPYHAGLDNEHRKLTQDYFIKGKINIVVATIAFGMGIDKSNVRLVVHYNFPKTLEGYYQEIGRAGRDGLKSECVLFYSRGDMFKHEFFVKQIENEDFKNFARRKLESVMNYCESKVCRRKILLRYFGEDFPKDNCNSCDICLKEKDIEIKSISKKIDFSSDSKLFEKLRLLRRKLAEEKGFSPFIIFNDEALYEMTYYLPKNENEFLKIKGVGNQKLKEFGYLFLDIVKNHVKEDNSSFEKNIILNEKSNIQSEYYFKTKEMILEKKSLEEIAKAQSFSEGTIINHIERIVNKGEKINIDYLFPSKEKFNEIKIAFEKLGTEKLALIYNYFNEEFSYKDIRLVRIALNIDNFSY